MRTLDWIVLLSSIVFFVGYGVFKGRGTRNIKGFFLADRSMRWYTVALSIMATQASAVTFTSTPGQAYADGMRFVQFYLGLPIAMVILCITVVPVYHKLGVYTAYEYLEQRFDLKTRVLTSLIFLAQRGLAVGITIYAPSIILSVMLGLDVRITSTLTGGAVIIYTTLGGVKAVNWTDFQQMIVIVIGMLCAFFMAVTLLPADVGFSDALHVAGGMGKLNAIDFSFDLTNRYNFWSGLIGGMFVALAYFGTDQSQVQRYLTGQSVTQSRLGLLFNGIAKVPMQFFILLLGVMVFVFYQFTAPPLFFNPVEVSKLESSPRAGEFKALELQHEQAFQEKAEALRQYLEENRKEGGARLATSKEQFLAARKKTDEIRANAIQLVKSNDPDADANDTNYVFLSFVLRYLPTGLVGLVFACIFAATMSSTSGELSSLATTTVVDVYKRLVRKEADEKHYLAISRMMMALWGIYAISFAQYAGRLGTLIEAVNILGSLFYGTMLGIFLLAFYFKSIGGTPTFIAAFAGEIVVLGCFKFTDISWLWYNVIGCSAVVGTAFLLNMILHDNKTSSVAR